jgi:CSLREA domain-containing protein
MTRSAVRLCLALIALLAMASSAQATVFEVTTTADQNDGCANNGCSLRDAMAAANVADVDSVHVPASATPYSVTLGHIPVAHTITLQGDGAGTTTISGDADNRILFLNGAGKTLTIVGVTLSNGHAPDDGSGNALGGAIEVAAGAVDVKSSVLTGNVAAGSTGNGRGGAVDVVAGSGNSASVTDSAVTGNQATSASGAASGGGLSTSGGAGLTVLRSSVTANSASTGGTSTFGGGISSQGPLSVINSTISGNSASSGSAAQGGGVAAAAASATTAPFTHVTLAGNTVTVATGTFRRGGNMQIGNNMQIQFTGSLIADGTGAAGFENCFDNGSGSFVGLGSNLEDRNQCGLGVTELHDTPPQLLPGGSFGGLTQVRPIPFGSPARNAAGSCGLSTDQRGLPRTDPCDIGAFEYQAVAPVVSAAADRASATTGDAVGFSASATDSDPGDASTLSWAFDDGATATGASASHAFATPGSHTATVTATDPAGLQSTATATVSVSLPPAPAPGPGPAPVPVPDTTLPGLTGLAFAPSAFSAASSGASVRAAATRPRVTGSKVSYRLTEAATVTFTVEQATAGRRVRGRCVPPTRANRTAPKCTRFVALRGSFTHAGKAGLNSLRFTGRVGGRKLAPGPYRLVAVARDAAGNRSKVVRQAFRIIR